MCSWLFVLWEYYYAMHLVTEVTNFSGKVKVSTSISHFLSSQCMKMKSEWANFLTKILFCNFRFSSLSVKMKIIYFFVVVVVLLNINSGQKIIFKMHLWIKYLLARLFVFFLPILRLPSAYKYVNHLNCFTLKSGGSAVTEEGFLLHIWVYNSRIWKFYIKSIVASLSVSLPSSMYIVMKTSNDHKFNLVHNWASSSLRPFLDYIHH